MPKIEILELRACNPSRQRKFYQEILGMHDLGDGCLRYKEKEAGIRFLPAETCYLPKSNDVYWKIALAIPNIELAYTQLVNKGVTVGKPRQFQDIGYLAHFQDPEGFVIELIEHHFEGDRPNTPVNRSLLGGGAHLNLITLRATEIEPIEKMIKKWGMKPLSIQPVNSYEFTLYFYAFTSDAPPCINLYAIENRTWVYQRPYTVLEIQHVPGLVETRTIDKNIAGYNGLQISSNSEPIEQNGLAVSSFFRK